MPTARNLFAYSLEDADGIDVYLSAKQNTNTQAFQRQREA